MTLAPIVDIEERQAEFNFYGANREFVLCKGPETILWGPAETGKTISALWKLHRCALKYPNASIVIARKQLTDTYASVLKMFGDKVLVKPEYWNIGIYGGEKPQWYDYSNGSRIWVAGMDKSGKVLSSEHDIIYVNQAEELSLEGWETLTTRTTGRAGNMPYAQTIGDANPAGKRHWIRQRKGLKLFHSTHRDNPVLYNIDGTLTAQGERTMSQLENLTGVRRKRLLEGKWATAEGAVYDMFSRSTHVKKRPRKEMKRFALAMDEGYTNPAVILDIGVDGDDRWHIFDEYYETGKLQDQIVSEALEYNDCRRYVVAVDSAAAGLIASLQNANLPARAAKGRVLDGIWHIQDRLQVQGDGRPRLTVDPSCVNTINEFESYIWQQGKDKPQKENDHAMDALRYFDDASQGTWLI